MVINADGIYGESLHMGVQTNPDRVYAVARWKAAQWAPNRARSFTISDFRDTDYHGRRVPNITGYARFTVTYYSRTDEGECCLADVPAEYPDEAPTEPCSG